MLNDRQWFTGTWKYLALLCLGLLANGRAAELYQRTADSHPVEVLKVDWSDAKRNRKVPAQIYFPKDITNPRPVIVFSHGLGGSRYGYQYLGRHWASNGYVSVHLQHVGSDDAVWRRSAARPMQAMRQAVLDPVNAINRPLDVSFAIDQLGTMHTSAGPLRGKLDLARIGMAGHSFGAWTALAIAGQQFGPNQRMLADKRVKAAVAMSAPAPAQRSGKSFSQVRIPILHMTGTLDDSPIGETAAKDRRVPFDLITNAPEFLITFDGGDHMVFSGETRPNRNRVFDEEIHDLIRAGTLAFWDAWLRDEPKAKAWLEQDFSQVLGARGTIEKRLPAVIH